MACCADKLRITLLLIIQEVMPRGLVVYVPTAPAITDRGYSTSASFYERLRISNLATPLIVWLVVEGAPLVEMDDQEPLPLIQPRFRASCVPPLVG